MVHKEVACYYSAVLGVAFNSTFIEGQTQKYTLEDTTPRAVRLLVQWMYGRKLHLIQAPDDSDGPLSAELSIEARESEDLSLAELWVLADKLCIGRLQNTVIFSIFRISQLRGTIPTSTYQYIFENTTESSKLRKFTIDFALAHASATCFQFKHDHFPRKMFVAPCLGYSKERVMGRGCGIPTRIIPATYYVLIGD